MSCAEMGSPPPQYQDPAFVVVPLPPMTNILIHTNENSPAQSIRFGLTIERKVSLPTLSVFRHHTISTLFNVEGTQLLPSGDHEGRFPDSNGGAQPHCAKSCHALGGEQHIHRVLVHHVGNTFYRIQQPRPSPSHPPNNGIPLFLMTGRAAHTLKRSGCVHLAGKIPSPTVPQTSTLKKIPPVFWGTLSVS